MQDVASVLDSKRESMNNDADTIPSEQEVLSKHYHKLEKIGHGAQATMLKALDEKNHPVAIKVFDFGGASGWKDFDLFEREIEVLKNLHVDGVPRYIETIRTDKKLYLVEEYIDALSLEKQLKSGCRYTAEECRVILKKAARILQKLSDHNPPIIHRDIKPANLLVDKNLNVYLVDFGVVAKTNQTISTTFAGTAGYVSPEQIYGKTTPASDIYSLGATILHLITHVAPCDMQRNGIAPDFDKYIPKSVPSWLSETIKKMMSTDPAQRPQTGDELIAWIDTVRNKRTKSKSLEHTQSENHIKVQIQALATDDDKTSPRSLVKRYRRYGRRSTIWVVVTVLSVFLFFGSFFLVPFLNTKFYAEEERQLQQLESTLEHEKTKRMVESMTGFGRTFDRETIFDTAFGRTFDRETINAKGKWYDEEKVLGTEDYHKLQQLRSLRQENEDIALILHFCPIILILISGIAGAVYSSKQTRLLSSLPGLVDVNTEHDKKALKGDALSQYFIGRKYELEDGAIHNERVALAWYALSAEGGCAEAKAKIP